MSERVQTARIARIEYLDIIRVLSMAGVVFWHVAAGVTLRGYGTHAWEFANVVTSLITAAVPLFFMISGALMLDDSRTESVGFVFKRRLPKIFVPFLAWSLIGIVFLSVLAWHYTGNLRLDAALSRLIHMPLMPTMAHLWFMYALVVFYVFSPALKIFVDNAGRTLVLYMLILWFIFASLLPTIGGVLPMKYASLATVAVTIPFNSLLANAGFFVGGYYAYKLRRRFSPRLLGLVAVVDIAAMATMTALQTRHFGSYVAVAKMYNSVFAVILTFTLFFLAKELMRNRQLKPSRRRVVGFFARLSFGVYLCHLVVLTIVEKLFHFNAPMPLTRLCAFYVLTLGGSVLLTWFITRLKPLCFVLTGQKYRPWRAVPTDASQMALERPSDNLHHSG